MSKLIVTHFDTEPTEEAKRLLLEEKKIEYEICQKRGHQPSNYMTASSPPQNICKWCGTYYWYTTPELREGMGKPV